MKLKKTILFTGLLLTFFFLSSPSVLAATSIATADDFNNYAKAINDGTLVPGDADYNAVLTANIDLGTARTTTFEQIASFDGIFSGQDAHGNIFRITASSDCKQGLFGQIEENGRVENLYVNYSEYPIHSTVPGSCFGAISVSNYGTISNCHAQSTFYVKENFGGITSSNYGTISDCSSYCSIIGSIVGGIATFNYGTISGCSSLGNIRGDIAAGGIAAENYGSINGFSNNDNCTVSGFVIAKSNYAGGVAALNFGSISGYTISASVSGTDKAGGVAAKNCGVISGCSVSNSVSGYNKVGGIAFDNETDGIISGCSVSATLSCDIYLAGGITENNSGTILHSYCLKDSTKDINKGLKDVGSDVASPTEDTAKQFSSGQITWELQSWEDNSANSYQMTDSTLFWGQTNLGDSGSLPFLTKDASQKVYRLSLFKYDTVNDQMISIDQDYYGNAGDFITTLPDPTNIDPAYAGYQWIDANGKVYSNTDGSQYQMTADDNGALYLLKTPELADFHSVVTNEGEAALTYSAAPYQIFDSSDFLIATQNAGTTWTPDSLSIGTNTFYIRQNIGSVLSPKTEFTIHLLNVSDSKVQISSPEDFNAFATYINNGWDASSGIKDAVLTADISLDSAFTQISNYSATFDGNSHTIIMGSKDNACTKSIISKISSGGILKNLIVDGYISSNDSYVGGICSSNDGGTITGCTVSAEVSSSSQTSYVGGICGENNQGSISNCSVSNVVENTSSTSTYLGGVTAYNNKGSITGCSVSASVSGSDCIGGIAGYNFNETISNCTVTTTVFTDSSSSDPDSFVGGIIGYNCFGSIRGCSATASVTSEVTSDNSYLGGIAGYNDASDITNCFVSGTVNDRSTATASFTGGIAGHNEYRSITNCFVTATVFGNGNLGGIVGDNNIGDIKNVYYLKETGGPNSQIFGISTQASDPENIFATSSDQFASGSVAWALHDWQVKNPDPLTPFNDDTQLWGQLLSNNGSEIKDAIPVLKTINDGNAYQIRQVHQLLFYDTDGNTSLPDLTTYVNHGATVDNYPAPDYGYRWMNGSTEFTITSSVTSDLSLVKTSLPLMTGITVQAVTTTKGNSPGFNDYHFANLPTDSTIYYSLDANRSEASYSTTPPTFSATGTVTVYFKITAPGYLNNTDLSTTVTVKNPTYDGGNDTPPISGITIPEITTTPDGDLNFNIDDLPDGSTIYYSTDGINYSTTPPSFSDLGQHTVYLRITAPGYQTLTTTTTVTVSEPMPDKPILLNPLDSGSIPKPGQLPGGGFGISYSYNLGQKYPSGASFRLGQISDPFGILAGGQNGPGISGDGLFSCIFNYAAKSPGGMAASLNTSSIKMASETDQAPDGQDSSPAEDTENSDEIAIFAATVVIDVTLASGESQSVTLDLEMPQRFYNIDYRTHIQNIGWEDDFSQNGAMSGTQGQSLRLEAIEIKADGDFDLGVRYRTHVENIGWEETYVTDGQESGTDGKGLRLEAIELSLTGADADYFDIYYQVHVQNLGWLDWAKNGDPAGSAGFGYRLEGIQIVVVPKGAEAPGATQNCFVEK